MKAFLCYRHQNSDFVTEVAKYLNKNLEKIYYYDEFQEADTSFQQTIRDSLEQSDVFIIFLGECGLSKWQRTEISIVERSENQDGNEKKKHIYTIILPGYDRKNNKDHELFGDRMVIDLNEIDSEIEKHFYVAKKIVKSLDLIWKSDDDLPLDPHLFDYEKHIINYFIEKKQLEIKLRELEIQLAETKEESCNEELSSEHKEAQKEYVKYREKMLNGCPSVWPEVTYWTDETRLKKDKKNKIPSEILGNTRSNDATVSAAALSNYYLDSKDFTFPEAGPRESLYFPKANRSELNVGIVVSGGIAPGTNAVIDGITQRHHMYAQHHNYTVEVFGFINGFQAFDNLRRNVRELLPEDAESKTKREEIIKTSYSASDGGSIIGTSRYDPLMSLETKDQVLGNILRGLNFYNIDILYVIGGDGSMKAAHAIWNFAKVKGRELSVVAIPKTMDNDILWVWQSFGFLSAVERARELVEHLGAEIKSNPRLGVMQLFGSDSGFVVSHAVLASRTGVVDVALIPEIKFSMEKLVELMRSRMRHKRHGFIVLAETAIPTDAKDFIDDPAIELSDLEKEAVRRFEKMRRSGKRIEGQTDDALRHAGLKIVSRGLKKLLLGTSVGSVRVFTNEPRHLLRSAPPISLDIITAQRLGLLAVDNALAGYTDFMVSQWLTEYVLVPLKLVVLGRKRIPESGIFWKSVLSKTGQPEKMT